MLIDKAGVARLIPHAGAMCLLDGVLSWDHQRISCAATSHRATTNPLRRDGKLGILCGVEYAAQAMALHAALNATGAGFADRTQAGFLASLRALACHLERLDLLTGTLLIEADCLHGDSERAIYRFALSHQAHAVLDGRAAVVLRTR